MRPTSRTLTTLLVAFIAAGSTFAGPARAQDDPYDGDAPKKDAPATHDGGPKSPPIPPADAPGAKPDPAKGPEEKPEGEKDKDSKGKDGDAKKGDDGKDADAKGGAAGDKEEKGDDKGEKKDAKDGKDAKEKKPTHLPQASSRDRALPEYGGEPQPTTAGDVALWFPRVLFYPAYLATEYLVRVPIGTAVTWAEHHDVVSVLKDWFTFGPNNNIGLVPTGLIDFKVRPSVGVYGFYDDFIVKDNNLRMHVAYGGNDWYSFTAQDTVKLDKLSHVAVRFAYWQRPDWPFFGIGSRSLQDARSRYEEKSTDASFSFHAGLSRSVVFHAIMGLRNASYSADGSCCGDPSLADSVANGTLTLPPGFGGYTAYKQTLQLTMDSRQPRPQPGTGARLELHGEYDTNLRDPENSRWVKYGGTLGGFLDVTGHNNVLSLSVDLQFVDPVGDDKSDASIPFEELAQIGGFYPMRGFLYNRAFGRSAAVATLEYRYPIWAFLDGSLQFAMGNVYDEHLSNFSSDLLRMSWSAGIRSNTSRDHSFDFMIGQGSETFADGAKFDDLRLMFGGNRAF